MSHNQSRGERSESAQYRKTGRSGSSNQPRQFSGGAPNKGGGGASFAPSNPSNRGGYNKKYNSNAQGGQSRPRSPNVSSDSSNSAGPPAVQNGAHQQQPTHRLPDAPVTSNSSSVQPSDNLAQKISRAVPRAPSSNVTATTQLSNVSNASSESKAPATPAKGDASKSFPLQFGSISPGFMNGMQIPARTSSAPPNLDEQKKDQVRNESSRAAQGVQIPSIPKQHLRRETGIPEQPNAGEAQPPPKSKRDTQLSASPPVSQMQKPSAYPIPGMHMQVPFHQLQVPVQFGGPNPQIQSQAMSGASLQMPIPIPLPIGNSPVQPPMFVSGLQPHPMQSQGMIHQGQSLSFSSQMGAQLPPQLGNMGMNMAPQFPQQQAGKYSGSRKTVKITHPETHEELRLDASPGPRSHPNAPPQSQPIPSFPHNHPMNIYPNYFSSTSSVPLSSAQVSSASQPPRRYNQVTVKPAVGSHQVKEPLAPTSSLSGGKTEALGPSSLHGKDSVHLRKEIQPSSVSSLPQSRPGLGTPSALAASSGTVNATNDVANSSDFASAPMDSAPVSSSSANETRNVLVVPDSTKDELKKLGKKEQLDQVGKQSMSVSSLPSQLLEIEAADAKSTSSGTSLVSDISKKPLSTTVATSSETYNKKSEGDAEGKIGVKIIPKEREEAMLDESSKPDAHILETSLRSLSLESPDITVKSEENPNQEVTARSAAGQLEETQQKLEELSGRCSDDVNDESSIPATSSSAHEDKTSKSNVLSVPSNVVDQESASFLVSSPLEGSLKPENGDMYSNSGGVVSSSSASLKDKVSSDTNVTKTAAPRGKKKKKELYRKAEAAGTSSDLYMAYKGPEEKKETLISSEGNENTSTVGTKPTSMDLPQEAVPSGKPDQSKVEPDDWEDAAEISTPQLETSNDGSQGIDRDGNGLMTKRYTRDFLLKFLEHCIDLPEGFEITSDIADALMVSNISVSREPHPSPGRNIDRPHSRDRRGNGLEDEDKWNKFPGPLVSGRGDMRTDIGYVGNVGFRPGQGGNYGVLRNPRAQAPVQYAGGILYGPMQSLGPPVGLQRNTSDSDRWQRGTGFQKGLMPYPQAPLPVMHKAEKKYEIGKVTDEEQAKQRQLKGILNKLTPQNFEKLFQQVKEVNIDNVVTLSGVISQIFDKALMEPTFCEMYADFCFHLAAGLPDLSVDNERITFKRLLLNKCQEEFERGEREEEEAKKAEVEGESNQTAEEREEKRLQTRRRMLGNIRLIGELYKKKMLTERIMHECINKLLGQYQNPDEENIEALCKLMSTIGEMIDHPKAREHMDAYFNFMAQLSNNMKLSSRVRFMLKDAIDLRKNKWQQRRKVEGPKKIEEVHRDAAQERHAQASRLARAPSMGGSMRRTPMEFAPRAPSMLSSPTSQIGGYRAVPPQMRGHGSQDARIDERRSFENRTVSVPLPQRPAGDDSITLGPQGGLARGMAFRGPPSAPNITSAEMPGPGDSRRMGSGPNGFNSMPERSAYNLREDLMPRYMPDRFAAPSSYEQSHPQEPSITYGNKEIRNLDRSFDRSLLTSPPARGGPPTSMLNVSSEKVLSEEHLRDKSMTTIKEFYSARDESEVALCIKDLNAPAFYPSMIAVWISDSFERKDTERDLLTKLLINLAKSRDVIISENQLIKGFESVLAVLEDAVNDAPKAAEYLGRIFAKVILESIVSLSEIGRLIYEGGEEQGQLVECGLAAEVLGSILDIIKSEKGDSVLNEIRLSSNLRLENFKPPGSKKSLKIDKFIS